MTKEKVRETLSTLPDEFKTEELIERLLFIEKVEEGLLDVKEGKVLTIEEVEKRFQKKWQTRK